MMKTRSSNKELVEVGFRMFVPLILCAVVVELTQMIAMIIVVGTHEYGHAIVGMAFGETLKGLPSISITGLTPVSVRGETTFTDNLHATTARVMAGPTVNLLTGIVLSALLIMGKGYGWLKSGTKIGFAVEAVILILFWSGFAIVTQYTGSPGTDMGILTSNTVGQIFELTVVLFGMLIMVILLFGRAKKYLLKIRMIHEDPGIASKRRVGLAYPICFFAGIIMLLTAPVFFGHFLGWLFMAVTAIYYAWLMFEYKRDFAVIGQDLAVY
jgi:hypothetical protein